MPCRCDHMEPTEREAESRRVARLIEYVADQVGFPTPDWIKEAAGAVYGNRDRADELTASLCAHCLTMEGDPRFHPVIYDGRDPRARDLADWWQAHQEADARRKDEEAGRVRATALRASGMAKLTPDERAALGLNPLGDVAEA